MRNAFFDALCEIAVHDEQVILLYADTGALVLDEFRKEHADRCINMGISEQNMIGIASGLAMNKKIVYIYAIVPFVMMRSFEQIRIDVCYQNLPVKVVGIGAGVDYSTLGPTHHALEDIALMRSLPGMTILSPSDDVMAAACAKMTYEIPGPVYIRLDRTGEPLVYKNGAAFSDGLSLLSHGRDLCLIGTGRMVHMAQQVAGELTKHSIDAGVIDLYRIKPLNKEGLLKAIGDSRYVATLEEHNVIGGIGSAVAELLAESGKTCGFKRLGLPDKFCQHYGTREYLLSQSNLSMSQVTDTLSKWIIE
ncbi:transketolase family protein [Chloroflexota bacterium]